MKQLKIFLTKIRPIVPLTEAPLVRPKGLMKGRGTLVSSIFSTKIILLFTPAISYTLILLSFSIHILSFAHTLTHNSHHFFWKNNNWHHCLWKENKDAYILLYFSIHILFFVHILTHNSRHFFFWKDSNWHIVYGRKKRRVLTYYFPLLYTYFSLHIH